jgi:protein-S-isoprenylcysteine O-methyltransferase Ste14
MSNDWFHAEWLVFALVWLVGATTTKRTVRRESIRDRIVHAGLFAPLGFLLLFEPQLLGRLDVRFAPNTKGTWLCGLIITGIGLALAIWARLRLGRNWSGTVTIKENHQLIRQGPYRLVRHPIYLGILLAMVGTAIGYGKAPCLIGVPIVFLAFWKKSRVEEQFMIAQFGAQYFQYQREVKAIIPGLL